MLRSTSRPNSPKPLAVPAISTLWISLELWDHGRWIDFSFPCLCRKAINLCRIPIFSLLRVNLSHRLSNYSWEIDSLLLWHMYLIALYVGKVAHWQVHCTSQETLARSGPNYQNSAIYPEFLQSISQGRFPHLQDNFPKAKFQKLISFNTVIFFNHLSQQFGLSAQFQ